MLAGVWGLAEATVWPIIPDFLLVALAVANRRHFHRPLLAAIAGMAVGGTITVLFAWSWPDEAARLARALPLVTPHQMAVAQATLAADGITGFFYQPFSGSSFKVWAVVAGQMHLAPSAVIPAFIVARAARMTAVTLIAAGMSRVFASGTRDFFLPLAIIYIELYVAGLAQVVAG